MRINKNLIWGIFLSIVLVSCVQTQDESILSNRTCMDVHEVLKISNWNTQTFFDSMRDGDEYDDFVKSKVWGKEAYIKRLERLCSTIKQIDADVFIFEELENESVIHDINNFLGMDWDIKKNYISGAFAKEDGSSIGCGLISRYPLSKMSIHTIDARCYEDNQPSMRPIIQVSVTKNGEELVLLINHWKSKSGGEKETEKWRNYQENILADLISRLNEEKKYVVAVGDFNRDINDFNIISSTDLANVTLMQKNGSTVSVKSPWYKGEKLIEPGSYVFNGFWERIDNFFFTDNVVCQSFIVETDGPWCDESCGFPIKYEIWNGSGYSDHLPLSAVVVF